MPRAKDVAELIEGMDPRHKGRGRTIAEFAKRAAMLQAADEIEKLLGDSAAIETSVLAAWVRATREEAALAAAEYERE